MTYCGLLQNHLNVGEEEEDDGDEMVLEPLGGEGQQGEEEHVGGRVGDELHKRVSHEPGFEINP